MTTPGVALSGGGASPREEARLNRQREPLPTDVGSLPPLPDEFERALGQALAILGLAPGGDARAAIDGHVRLLVAWNEAINLIAAAAPAEIAHRHVADSLAAVELIRSGPHGSILDLGSGGGFPGLPLAATLAESRVTLLDSIAKKTAFLEVVRQAVGLGERVDVATGRAEDLRPPSSAADGWDVVTARAVAALDDLVELALPLLVVGGRLIAWKRGNLSVELEAGRRAALALEAGEPAVHPFPTGLGLSGHVLVEVTKTGPTPSGYPRPPAVRKRRPW
jgi:16S rRNA (guanine527-N7)-methyltransferase